MIFVKFPSGKPNCAKNWIFRRRRERKKKGERCRESIASGKLGIFCIAPPWVVFFLGSFLGHYRIFPQKEENQRLFPPWDLIKERLPLPFIWRVMHKRLGIAPDIFDLQSSVIGFSSSAHLFLRETVACQGFHLFLIMCLMHGRCLSRRTTSWCIWKLLR